MRLTQPDKTRFAPLDAHWKDAAGNVVCGPALTSLLHSSLGAACSLGMQQLLKLRIAFILEDVFFDLQSLDAGRLTTLAITATLSHGSSGSIKPIPWTEEQICIHTSACCTSELGGNLAWENPA